MKKLLFLTAAFFMLCSTAAVAQLDYIQREKVEKLYKKNKIVYFKFPVHSLSEIPQLGKMISVEKSKGNVVFAHADKAQFSRFIKLNYNYTVLPPPQKKATTTTKKKTTTTTTTKKTTTKPPVKK